LHLGFGRNFDASGGGHRGGCFVEPSGRNRADNRGAANRASHSPGYSRIRGAGHLRRELLAVIDQEIDGGRRGNGELHGVERDGDYDRCSLAVVSRSHGGHRCSRRGGGPWRIEQTFRSDLSDRLVAAGDAIDLPNHALVCRVRHLGLELLPSASRQLHNRRRDGDGNGLSDRHRDAGSAGRTRVSTAARQAQTRGEQRQDETAETAGTHMAGESVQAQLCSRGAGCQ